MKKFCLKIDPCKVLIISGIIVLVAAILTLCGSGLQVSDTVAERAPSERTILAMQFSMPLCLTIAAVGLMVVGFLFVWARLKSVQAGLTAAFGILFIGLMTTALMSFFGWAYPATAGFFGGVAAACTVGLYMIVLAFESVRNLRNAKAQANLLETAQEGVSLISVRISTALIAFLVLCIAMFVMGGTEVRGFALTLFFGLVFAEFFTLSLLAPVYAKGLCMFKKANA